MHTQEKVNKKIRIKVHMLLTYMSINDKIKTGLEVLL